VNKQRHDGNASIKTGRETEGTAAVTDGQSLRDEKTLWIRDSYLSCEWTDTAQNRACADIVQGQGPEYPGNSQLGVFFPCVCISYVCFSWNKIDCFVLCVQCSLMLMIAIGINSFWLNWFEYRRREQWEALLQSHLEGC